MIVRRPAVAGTFYPGDPVVLAAEVDAHLDAARAAAPARFDAAGAGRARPEAIIAPHAGYRFSGPTAGFAYDAVRGAAVERVVVLGPAHRVRVEGLALSGADAWRTPLGDVVLDAASRDLLATHPACAVHDAAHAPEHSLEVQVPFLQRALAPGFTLVPLLVSRADARVVADVLGLLWGPTTLVVVSTDLSHYEDIDTARRLDRATAARIVTRDGGHIGPYDACGAYAVRGLLEYARRHDLAVRQLDLRTSGDTAGPPERVVGYGAFAVAG